MSPSSDIETLFGHFGGNAGDYQEIGRENEASTARTRWPLLVTLDLTQPSIPAIVQRRDPGSKQAGEDAPAQAAEGDKPAAPGAAGTTLTGPALLRSKAPLFARSHRRNIPPVANVVKVDAPRGAERFSALPQGAAPGVAATQAAAPTAATVAAVVPAAPIPPIPPIPPVVAPAAPGFASIAQMGNVPPVAPAAHAFAPSTASMFSTRLAVPSAARTQTTSSSFAAGATRAAAPAPAVATAQPGSILGKLFTPAARNPAPVAATPAAQSAAAPLASVFDRLRGETPATATPAPHSWLTNGPRRT